METHRILEKAIARNNSPAIKLIWTPAHYELEGGKLAHVLVCK